MSDPNLVRLCVEERKSRQPANEVQQNAEVVASHVERSERQQVVELQVTAAEALRGGGTVHRPQRKGVRHKG